MTLSRLTILFAALVLTACATPTPYKPADSQGEAGYSDQRLTENRVRVIFRGNSATLRETVENYLLLRSAEVTREAGYSWFEFDTRNTQADTNYYTDFLWPRRDDASGDPVRSVCRDRAPDYGAGQESARGHQGR